MRSLFCASKSNLTRVLLEFFINYSRKKTDSPNRVSKITRMFALFRLDTGTCDFVIRALPKFHVSPSMDRRKDYDESCTLSADTCRFSLPLRKNNTGTELLIYRRRKSSFRGPLHAETGLSHPSARRT